MPGRPRASIARALAVASLAVGLCVGLSGCGVRLDVPPPAIPTADAAEQARADAVATADAIAAQATALAGLGVADPTLATQIAAGSTAQAGALGGTWTPPARPSASADPSDDGASATDDATGAPTSADPTVDLVNALVTGAAQARAGAGATSGDTATLLGSIAVWRSLAAHQLASTLPAETLTGIAPTLPAGGTDLTAVGLSSLSGVDDLIRGLDAAAFGYETLAARTDDDARAADWAARATALRRAGEAVASAADVSGTAADPREALYDVADLVALDPSAAAASLETEVAGLWLTAPLPAGLRPAGVDAAVEALLRARELGPLAALDSPAAVLPGLAAP
ncbi:hypothetical protein FH969_00590 [Miniimonas arenae]|uniref:DUF4439 domain-containing protein n=1 Tax=Miniimonas arenae TaxID=676201 RepID=A0A5C5BI34_9MICO|nr:hypothetical protein [Miniimonas arenae]TNU77301.1 hypothetical protein FH969_00590 [Miniimonas arenae]